MLLYQNKFMNDIKVTVLMSVYNGEKYLPQSIESILRQTYKNFEFIIIDDNSSDKTSFLLQEYASLHEKIKLIKNEKKIGLTKSLNIGLNKAKGKYIARQDHDDISLPERLEKEVKYLEDNPEVVLVTGHLELIDSQGKILEQTRRYFEPPLIAWLLLFYNAIGGHSLVMYRKEEVLALNGYSEEFLYSQDHELWQRLVKKGNFMILPKVLLQWRQHDQNISSENKTEQDALSLKCTQKSVSQLIGEDISLIQSKDLRNFWLHQLPAETEAKNLQIYLKRIFKAYLEQNRTKTSILLPQYTKLRHFIGKQFILCEQNLSFRKSPKLNLKLLFYAFLWNPKSSFIHYVFLPWQLMIKVLRKPIHRMRDSDSS